MKNDTYRCCKNCKYWTGKDELELERCVKHDHLMWGIADGCKSFGPVKEGEKQ